MERLSGTLLKVRATPPKEAAEIGAVKIGRDLGDAFRVIAPIFFKGREEQRRATLLRAFRVIRACPTRHPTYSSFRPLLLKMKAWAKVNAALGSELDELGVAVLSFAIRSGLFRSSADDPEPDARAEDDLDEIRHLLVTYNFDDDDEDRIIQTHDLLISLCTLETHGGANTHPKFMQLAIDWADGGLRNAGVMEMKEYLRIGEQLTGVSAAYQLKEGWS